MLSDELKSIRAALGELVYKLDEEGAELLRQCRSNLEVAEGQALALENNLSPVEAV
ncbi:MAG: hypothetical protein J1E80_06680 [Desulfovibrionaceae bacterium]|nr:hypothetical protein [Desulfovibrionaceae bacterium]